MNASFSGSSINLDPRTKLLLCIVISLVTFSGQNAGIMAYVLPCLAAFPLVAFILLKKPIVVLYYVVSYAFAIVVPPMIVEHVPAVINVFFTGIIAVATKILPAMSMFALLLMTTTMGEFVAAMDKMKVSKKIIVPISVIFRFIPTIKEEYGAIKNAMKLRNVKTTGNPIKMLEYRLVPLLTGLVYMGNELSASALTRGLDAPIKRTHVCEIGFKIQDFIAFLLCFVVVIIYILSLILGV